MSEPPRTALWERDVLIIFCDLCAAEIAAGNRPTTHFNKEGWNNLVAAFARATGRSYDRTQLKNKWDHLKKEWKMWKDLLRGSTGLGWDATRKTVSASEAWWAEKMKINPNYRKFKSNGIDPELEEKLELMFSGVVATGGYAYAPSERGVEEPIIEEQGSSSEFRAGDSHAAASQDRPNTLRQSSGVPATSRSKRKRSGSILSKQIDELVSACKSIPSATSTVIAPTTIQQAIKVLEEMPQLNENLDLYLHSLEIIRDDRTREIVVHMDPERRLAFLLKRFHGHPD